MVQSFLVKDEGRPLSLKKIAGHRGVQEKDYGPDKHRTSNCDKIADKIKTPQILPRSQAAKGNDEFYGTKAP